LTLHCTYGSLAACIQNLGGKDGRKRYALKLSSSQALKLSSSQALKLLAAHFVWGCIFAGAVLLLIAGLSKIYSTGPIRFFSDFHLSRYCTIELGVIEVVSGLCLALFWRRRLVRLFGTTMFLVLFVVSLLNLALKSEECNCLVGINTQTKQLVIVDAILSWILFATSFSKSGSKYFCNAAVLVSDEFLTLSRGIVWAILFFVLLSATFLQTFSEFSQLVRGNRVIIDQSEKVEISNGEVKTAIPFTVSNLDNKPIELIGFEADCSSSLSIDGLPSIIEPYEKKLIVVNVNRSEVQEKTAAIFSTKLFVSNGYRIPLTVSIVDGRR